MQLTKSYSPDLDQQIKISKMLSIAFVLSILGLGGVGSLFALVIGIRALRLIKRSHGQLTGSGLAWWCIVVGRLVL